MAGDTERPLPVDRAALTPVVRRALGSAAAEVLDWTSQPLGHRAVWATTAGLHRFSGMAADRGQHRAWSCILKIARIPAPPGASYAVTAGGRDPGSASYWKGEALLYASGALDRLPGGLAAPRCYGVTEPDDETAWIWLEEVADTAGQDWPVSRFGRVARQLGRFNGAYLVGEPLPNVPGLCAHWLRSEVGKFEASGSPLPSAEVWDHPAVRGALPPAAASRAAAAWETREELLDAVDRLPQAFCHRDFFPNNLRTRHTEGGEEQTVVIDWAISGPGPIGEDAFRLVSVSSLVLPFAGDLRELDAVVFEQYLMGLRDAGWSGDPRLVRLGYAAWSLGAPVYAALTLPYLVDPEKAAAAALRGGMTAAQVVTARAELLRFVLDLADEARQLLRAVP
jgi:hypothetical protein